MVLVEFGLVFKLGAVMVWDEGGALCHVQTRKDQLFGYLVYVLHGEEVRSTLIVAK